MRASAPPAARACTSASRRRSSSSTEQDPGEHLAELALHWRLAAVSVDKAKAADYALRAGQRALESLAPAEAVKLFADAVELTATVDSRERCEALIGLGEAQRQTGDAAYRETLLEASRIASALGDAELAARAALANSRGYTSVIGEIDEERLAAIDRAIELDDPPHPARRARLLALQALELLWRPRLRASQGARRGGPRARPRATGEATDALPSALRLACFAYWSAQTLELRTALATELAECAAELAGPGASVLGARDRTSRLHRTGRARPRARLRWSARSRSPRSSASRR